MGTPCVQGNNVPFLGNGKELRKRFDRLVPVGIIVRMPNTALSVAAIEALQWVSEKIQAHPSITIGLAVLTTGIDTHTRLELIKAIDEDRIAGDLQGADAVEAIESLLSAACPTIPAPAPTVEAPPGQGALPLEDNGEDYPMPTPERRLRYAIEHLEAAIQGFGPGPGTARIEWALLDLRSVASAVDASRALAAETAE